MNRLFSPPFYKVVILGDSGVGKTSLLQRFVHNKYFTEYKATIGADFLSKEIVLSNNKEITLQIWDTAGQERFVSLCSTFFRGSDCCVLVYDITNSISLDGLEKWYAFFMKECEISDPSFPIIVIGNKHDIKSEDSISNLERAKSWCEKRKIVHYFSSARDGENVDQIFLSVAELLYQTNPSIIDGYDMNSMNSLSASLIYPINPNEKEEPEDKCVCYH